MKLIKHTLKPEQMKTNIETLTTAKQVIGRTYVEDANSTIVRDEFGFFVTKHDYLMESKRFKTFRGAWNYMYCNNSKRAK